MIKAESVHSAPPKHVCNHPESSQDWLNAGDASSREVFEAAQAGTAGRGGLRQYVPTKILLSLTVALLFGSSLEAADGLLRLRRDRKVAVVVLFKGEAAAGPSPQRRLSSETRRRPHLRTMRRCSRMIAW